MTCSTPEEIQQLHERGWSNKRIAKHLQCHPKTVQRTLQRDLPLTVGRAGWYRNLDAYVSYLLKRWDEGCHNLSQVYRELQGQRYDGGCTIVRTFIVDLQQKRWYASATTNGDYFTTSITSQARAF